MIRITARGERGGLTIVLNKEFDECRKRLWNLLSKVDFSDGCKSYEGAIEVIETFPNYFCSPYEIPKAESFEIVLHCYVLGDSRHYRFHGKTFAQAISRFQEWLRTEERRLGNE